MGKDIRKLAGSARYSRQVQLETIGLEGQQKLLSSSVLCVGAGGLGCAALSYIVAAGVGNVGIVDPDSVELSNLHRQILYRAEDIGRSKALCAAEALAAMNGDVHIHAHDIRFAPDNALDFVRSADIVLDCTDNFHARFAINSACLELGTPFVSAAVQGFKGYVAFFLLGGAGPCLRCLMPEIPFEPKDETPASHAVIGITAGMLGVLEAAWGIGHLAGLADVADGQMLSCDLSANDFRAASISRDPRCPACSRKPWENRR